MFYDRCENFSCNVHGGGVVGGVGNKGILLKPTIVNNPPTRKSGSAHEFLILITNEKSYFIFEKMSRKLSNSSNGKSCNVSGVSRIDSQFCPLPRRASLLTHDVTLSKVWKKLKTSSGTHADGLPMMA